MRVLPKQILTAKNCKNEDFLVKMREGFERSSKNFKKSVKPQKTTFEKMK